jgi:hypothetical protein
MSGTGNISACLDWRVAVCFGEGPLFFACRYNKWTFTFSRGIRDRKGQFRGIVQSSIPSEWLAKAFSSITVRDSDVVALINTDLVLIARTPDAPDQIGKVLSSQVIKKYIEVSPEQGSYTAPASIDGVVRIFSYKKVVGLPIYVIAWRVSKDRILSPMAKNHQ